MKLWMFEMRDMGTPCKVYSTVKPPAWSDNMASATLEDAPVLIAECFTKDAQETFRREYGAPLHTVLLYPDGSIKQNARVA